MNDEAKNQPLETSEEDSAAALPQEAAKGQDPVRTYTRIFLGVVVVLFISSPAIRTQRPAPR